MPHGMGSNISPVGIIMGKLQKLGLYIRTLLYLKPTQIFHRIKRKISPVKIDATPPPTCRSIDYEKLHFILRPKSFLSENEFQFLNRKEKLSFPKAWNDELLPKLWLYNLHYFEGLINKDTSTLLQLQTIERWIKDTPPGQGNGWEPYPNSLRIVNWIKWCLSGNILPDHALHSLAVQTRYLTQTLEYHLLGNHLFANAKALIFAGLFFAGTEADKWFNKGFSILKEQIPEQFLADGGHFELSTTYHALLTEDLLDILQILTATGKKSPLTWRISAQKSVEWLAVMTRPDGLPPLFNDASYGITPSLNEIISLAKTTGLKEPSPPKTGITDLPESGYFRYEGGTYSFFGDAGKIGPDYIPGHGHCDMLSFELSVHGQAIIVNTGTSTYEICERRQAERSTMAHNTVQIGENEQSEIWSGFRVGRRANIIERDLGTNYIQASHDGYKRLGAIHTRNFTFHNDAIHIRDSINGYNGSATCRIHLHPSIKPKLVENKVIINDATLEFENAKSVNIKTYNYAPEFNKRLPASVIEIEFSKTLTSYIKL